MFRITLTVLGGFLRLWYIHLCSLSSSFYKSMPAVNKYVYLHNCIFDEKIITLFYLSSVLGLITDAASCLCLSP